MPTRSAAAPLLEAVEASNGVDVAVLDGEQALEKAGGHGRFQFWHVIAPLGITYMSVNIIVYSFTFIGSVPTFECQALVSELSSAAGFNASSRGGNSGAKRYGSGHPFDKRKGSVFDVDGLPLPDRGIKLLAASTSSTSSNSLPGSPAGLVKWPTADLLAEIDLAHDTAAAPARTATTLPDESRQQACALPASHRRQTSNYGWMTQLNLACAADAEVKAARFGQAYFIGFMLGGLLFPSLADVLGRKKINLLTNAGCIACVLLLFLLSNDCLGFLWTARTSWTSGPISEKQHTELKLFSYYGILATLFLYGLAIPGHYLVAFVHASELCDKHFRGAASSLIFVCENCDYYVCALWFLATYSPTYGPGFALWFLFLACFRVFALGLVSTCTPESPKFFLSVREWAAARGVLAGIAAVNGKGAIASQARTSRATDRGRLSSQVDRSVSSSKVAPDTDMQRRLLVLASLWFCTAVVNWSLQFMTPRLPGNVFANFVAIGVGKLVGYGSCGPLSDRWGRKTLMMAMYILNGLFMFLYVCVLQFQRGPGLHLHQYPVVSSSGSSPRGQVLTTGLILLNVIANATAFGAIFIVTGELFPTEVRGTAFATSNFVGRVGSFLAPVLPELLPDGEIFILPFSGGKTENCLLLLSGICLASAAIMATLPETKGRTVG
eukprot:g3364.t1